MPDCQERDSGSYSDEEKPDSKKKSKAKVFVERDRPMVGLYKYLNFNIFTFFL